MKTYMVKEIFGPTLQGEGSMAGSVVKFLRFAGCNKWSGLEKDKAKSICSFCDTDFRNGKPLTRHEICAYLDELGPVKRVVISGGEPTLQLDFALLETLKTLDYEIHLETNGSRDIDDLAPMIDHITMSPKQSRSKTKLKWCDDLKILFPRINSDICLEEFSDFKATNKYLQPVWGANYRKNLADTIQKLYDNPGWRLSLQTHKMTGVK